MESFTPPETNEQRSIELIAATEKFSENDACFHWLRTKYLSLPAARDNAVGGKAATQQKKGDKLQLSALENDVKACDALRWSRFSFPSDPHHPLRSNYNNETANPTPVHVTVAETGRHEQSAADPSRAPTRVLLESSKKAKDNSYANCTGESSSTPLPVLTVLDREPSRSILREIVLKRNLEQQLQRDGSFGIPQDGAVRPVLGGYVAAPQLSDVFRFLLFPQSHHSLFTGPGAVTAAGPSGDVVRRRRETPQEVPCYLRGSVSFPGKSHLKLSDVEGVDGVPAEASPKESASHWMPDLSKVARVSLSGSCKLPTKTAAPTDRADDKWTSLTSRLWPRPDAVEVDVYNNSSRAERRYAPESGKVEKRTLVEDGLRVVVYSANPRHNTSLTTTRATVENSHLRYREQSKTSKADDMVTSVAITDAYDSAIQSLTSPLSLFPRNTTYRVQWRAGPGVEYCSSDRRTTIFGKLSSESWMEWPVTFLKRQLKVKLRNESCLMRPLEFAKLTADADAATAAAQECRGTAHEYLWATQGPKWSPKLLRGFDNDYSNLHHSQHWFSAFSVEVSKKKVKAKKRGDSGGDGGVPREAGDEAADDGAAGLFSSANVQAFANACFVDSFREYPRASVGFSLTSDIPRVTMDAFNKFMPRQFECSFSWFVAFKEKRLQTGLQSPELPEEMQYMRLSPVETFRHMKCGLTWKF